MTSVDKRNAMARKKSLAPPDMVRKKSIAPQEIHFDIERKGSQDYGRKQSISHGSDISRRMSMAHRRQSVVESLTGRSTLILTSNAQQKNVKYENTYKLEPDVKFQTDKIKSVIEEILENELADMTYKPEICVSQSKLLAEKIKQAVKAQDFEKYKLVVIVAIGENEASPSVSFTSRCIWNVSADNYSEYVYRNKSLYAVGMVYAVSID
ncbi:TCTEX1D2 [Mytilus coruscus]|uniref:TCTEX1D2 n=1 Tax=Mytilus coruscus TaxID=42192 RepID=A0A6J8CR32_MYTCO|nr:TCTEX1D2 [Mytilus coruscus]